MSDVKRLLDEATPLPWNVSANPLNAHQSLIAKGPKGGGKMLAGVWGEANTALIVYAVNHLPAYEAAVEALAQLVATIDREAISFEDDSMRQSLITIRVARKALRRLREEVPA